MNSPRFAASKIALLGLGMLGVNLVWQIYNAYIPIFLQAGRQDFAQGAGVKGFALDPTTAGFVMTLDNIAALLILPYIGVVSDNLRTRWGRRLPFLALGAPLAALAFAALPYTLGVSLTAMLAVIAVLLLAMDLFRTPLVALMPDLTPPVHRSKASGITTMLYNLGFVLAAIVGGELFKVSVAAPFLFGAAGLFVTMLVVVLFIREPARPEGNAGTEESPGLPHLLRNLATEREPSLRCLLAAVFTWGLGVSALEIFFTSFLVSAYPLDSGQATKMMAFFGLAGLVGAFPAGLLGARFGRRRMVMTGLALLILWLTLVNFAGSLTLVKGLLVLMGLSWSLVAVNAMPLALDMTTPDRGGSYAGLFFLSNQAASIIGPVLAGAFLDLAGRNYRALFLYIPLTMLGGWLWMLRVRRGEATTTPPLPEPIHT